jgi:hypothetical protein
MQARRTATACLAALTLGSAAAASPADARTTVVMCIGGSQAELQAYVKPRACVFKVAGKPIAGAYIYRLESLRWRHWGTRRATATGRFTGNMQYRVRTTVRLSRPSPCGDDRRGYTRFRMTRPGAPGTFSIPLDRCSRVARAAQRKNRSFYARGPRGIVGCEMADEPGLDTVRVVCQSIRGSRYQNAILDADGAIVWCRMRIPRQDGRCLAGDLGEDTRTYRVGRRVTVGRFRCQVLRSGVRCVVIATGRGFVYKPGGVRAIGGATIRHARRASTSSSRPTARWTA